MLYAICRLVSEEIYWPSGHHRAFRSKVRSLSFIKKLSQYVVVLIDHFHWNLYSHRVSLPSLSRLGYRNSTVYLCSRSDGMKYLVSINNIKLISSFVSCSLWLLLFCIFLLTTLLTLLLHSFFLSFFFLILKMI